MNEILFIGFFIFLCALILGALRCGKFYLFVLIAIFSISMNIFVTKQFEIFGILVTGGNAIYGAIFLSTDILSEYFSHRDALKSVTVGFFALIFFAIATQILIFFEPAEFDTAQNSIKNLFSPLPRILFGSFLAFFIAQICDIFLFHKIKKITKKKFLFVRNNFSTAISQFLDTLIFTAVGLTNFAFLPLPGVIEPQNFWPIFWATYLIKILVAAIDTPFLYLAKNFLPEKN